MEPATALRTYAQFPKVDIVVALRNQLARLGLERILQSLHSIRGFRSYGNLADALRIQPREETVLIFALDDIDEPARHELRSLTGRSPKTLVLVDDARLDHISDLKGMPVNGFLLTGRLDEFALHNALYRIQHGEVPIPTPLAHVLMRQAGDGGSDNHILVKVRLTAREKEVLVLLVAGMSNKQIARRLEISIHGVKRLVANILAKLDSPNRTTAVARAISESLLPIPPDTKAPRPDLAAHLPTDQGAARTAS